MFWNSRPALRVGAVGAALAVLAVAVALIASPVLQQLAALRSAPTDNAEWSLSQIEVDLLRFGGALRAVERGDAPPAEARRRYDLLYSRHQAMRTGSVFAALRADPDIAEPRATLDAFVAVAGAAVDAGDAALLARAPALLERLPDVEAAVRRIVLEGIALFARNSDRQRTEVVEALRVAFTAALGLIAALAATLIVLFRQNGVARARADGIRRSRARLAATVDASLDAIMAVDAEARLRSFNAAAAQVFGLTPGAVLGEDGVALLAPPSRRTALRRALRRCVARARSGRGVRARVETQARRADGTVFPAELSLATAGDEEGRVLIVVYLRDISERQAAERRLRAARDEAQAADRAKSRFLAVMSHEMRTPLNGVSGALELLASTELAPAQRPYVETARASAEFLRQRVEEALDIARIEKGALVLSEEAFDPAAALEEVALVVGPSARERGNRVIVDAAPDLGLLTGDANRLRQILLNLAANAARFTRDGTIAIEARSLAESDGLVEAEFAVRDDGVGIAAEDQRRIFDDFVTLDADGASGAGLGLPICNRLVAAMGGRMGVESARGEGSRFWFRIPLRRAASVCPEAVAEPGPLRPLRILCVEDNPTNRFVLREMLSGAGHAVVEARDGREALALAAGERFDVVLMDIGLPGMDGVATARAIRAAAAPAEPPPILALTAHALREDLQRFAEAGMRDCLTKPIRRAALLAAVAKAVSAAPPPSIPIDGLIDDAMVEDLSLAIGPGPAAETLRAFLADLPRASAALSDAARAGDDAGLLAGAHRLAGSAGMVGAAALRRSLLGIEDACRAGRAAEAREATQALSAVVAATAAALAERAARIADPAA